MARQVVRYSEAFKLRVVSDLESGALANFAEARERYGIAGGGTVQGWLRKYGKEHLIAKVVRVETAKERDEIKALKRRIRELEKALADTQVNALLNEGFFRVACQELGIEDPEEFKKKRASDVGL